LQADEEEGESGPWIRPVQEVEEENARVLEHYEPRQYDRAY
jgi:hypothetical protein